MTYCDDQIHVVPASDLIEHETNADCPCGPDAYEQEIAEGGFGYVYQHHALDGRECSEPDHDRLACAGQQG